MFSWIKVRYWSLKNKLLVLNTQFLNIHRYEWPFSFFWLSARAPHWSFSLIDSAIPGWVVQDSHHLHGSKPKENGEAWEFPPVNNFFFYVHGSTFSHTALWTGVHDTQRLFPLLVWRYPLWLHHSFLAQTPLWDARLFLALPLLWILL